MFEGTKRAQNSILEERFFFLILLMENIENIVELNFNLFFKQQFPKKQDTKKQNCSAQAQNATWALNLWLK